MKYIRIGIIASIVIVLGVTIGFSTSQEVTLKEDCGCTGTATPEVIADAMEWASVATDLELWVESGINFSNINFDCTLIDTRYANVCPPSIYPSWWSDAGLMDQGLTYLMQHCSASWQKDCFTVSFQSGTYFTDDYFQLKQQFDNCDDCEKQIALMDAAIDELVTRGLLASDWIEQLTARKQQ